MMHSFIMENPDQTIRNAIRAVIIQDGCVLLQEKQDSLKGTRYTLPGGAQEAGETITQTLLRECQEEIGATVLIGDLLYVAEYCKLKLLPEKHTRQQLEIFFSCQVPDSYIAHNGPNPDKHQVAIKWFAIDSLSQIKLQPESLSTILREQSESSNSIYLGMIN